MSYTCGVISLVWIIAVFTSDHVYGYNLGLKAKVDALSANMRQIEKQNSDMAKQILELANLNNELTLQNSELERQTLQLKENDAVLERKITKMQTKADSSTSLLFDCYLSSEWSLEGPIRFDGCDGENISYYFIPQNFLYLLKTSLQLTLLRVTRGREHLWYPKVDGGDLHLILELTYPLILGMLLTH